MAIQFELYKTPRPKDEEDKEVYHARVVNFQHIDTDYLAKEIQIATSLTFLQTKKTNFYCISNALVVFLQPIN